LAKVKVGELTLNPFRIEGGPFPGNFLIKKGLIKEGRNPGLKGLLKKKVGRGALEGILFLKNQKIWNPNLTKGYWELFGRNN